MDAKDFRPISLLAIFSKIIKRVKNMDYLMENNISVDINLVFARTIKQILP